MKISDAGIKFIKDHEGLVLFAYDDMDPRFIKKPVMPGDTVRGTLTIGYGHTGTDVKPGLRITASDADRLLDMDLELPQRWVSRLVTAPLTQNQFDALVDFVFNVGVENLRKSTLLERVNEKLYDAAADEFPKWIYSKGRIVEGLKSRREDERKLFLGV